MEQYEIWHLYQRTVAWHVKNIDLLRDLHYLVRALNKTDISPREEIFGFCKKFITKFTDYFFTVIDLGTASFGNGYLFNQQKDNDSLIKQFGQCILILMSIFSILVEFINFLKKMLMKIFSVLMTENVHMV